jgi:hypothetical protein
VIQICDGVSGLQSCATRLSTLAQACLWVDLRPSGDDDDVVVAHDGVSFDKWASEVDKFVDLCEREVRGKARTLCLASSVEEALHFCEVSTTVEMIRQRLPENNYAHGV